MNLAADINGRGGKTKNYNKFWWWEPPLDSLPFDFCRDTSLHGLKYIYQPRRHLSERIFWFLAFLICLTVTVFMILGVWNKFRDAPIIVSFETFETTVDEIPFPAVTICNMNKVQKRKANELITKLHDEFYTPEFDENQKNVYLLHHVCNVSSGFSKVFNFSLSKGAVNETDLSNNYTSPNETESDQLDIEKFLQLASPKCPEMLPLCIWHDNVQNCTKLFNPIETDFGKCCTFNMVSQSLLHHFRNDSRDDPEEIRQWSSWDLDHDGILIREGNENDPDGNIRKFPRRQKRAGKSFGLSILLDPDLDEYFCTSSDSVGFRLATHMSIDVPHVADFGIAIAPNTEVFVNVKPEITTAEEAIKNFSLDKRRCYFPKEHPLTYYNYYTTSNCIDECIAEQTFETCQCVRYYMPRDDNKTLCGPDKYSCAEGVKSIFLNASLKKYLLQGLKSNCANCLRSCSEIQYLMETTATKLLDADDNWQFENGSFARWRRNNVSIVHIFIGQPSTYARVRKQLYGYSDLMGQTGGIMGLCLGFSGLSLVELVYYFTLRPWWYKKWRNTFEIKIFDTVINAWTNATSKGKNQTMKIPGREGLTQRKTSFNSFSNSNPNPIRTSNYYNDEYGGGASHALALGRSSRLPIISEDYDGGRNNNNNNSLAGQNMLLNEINTSISRYRANGGGGGGVLGASIYRELGQLQPEYSTNNNTVGNENDEPSPATVFNEISPYFTFSNSINRQTQRQSPSPYWNV